MKTAFELAMERFGGPIREFTPEQKAQLADVDSDYESQIVQARFAAQSRLEKAGGDPQKEKQIQDELTVEIRSLEERRDRKKEKLRASFK